MDLIAIIVALLLNASTGCDAMKADVMRVGGQDYLVQAWTCGDKSGKAFSGDSATKVCDLLSVARPSLARDIGWSCIEVDGRKYARITNVWREEYSGSVYDLSVDGDPSYTVNGFTVHNSGKGFDDYALKNSFQYQAPIQALWVTHPDFGITATWPIYLQDKSERYR